MYMLILKKPLVSLIDQLEFVDQSEQCSVRDLAARFTNSDFHII